MLSRVSSLTLFGAVAVIACTTTAAMESRSPDNARQLAQALSGRVAGPPVSCVPNLRGSARMQVIDDNTLLFRDGGTVYLQKPRGGCPGLDHRGYTLVNRKAGSHQICEGDINQLVALETGTYGGTCIYGPFVPYRRVG